MTTYAEHLHTAATYAALILTMPTPGADPDRARVRVLQGDVAGLLAEMTRELTGLAPTDARRAEIQDVARHPVRTMLNRLATLRITTLGATPGVGAPSDRLVGRPVAPERAGTVVGAWQGMVVHLAQARHILAGRRDLISDQHRWAAVAELATFAQVVATTRTDLLATTADTSAGARLDRTHAAALSVEAGEVARLAGTPSGSPGAGWAAPQSASGIVPVSDVAHLPPATGNLARLVHRAAGNITDLLTVTALAAQTSRAVAAALRAATSVDPAHHASVGPVTIGLDAHADVLAAAVAAERTTLGALTPSSAVVIAQAREIGAFALPRLVDLAHHPGRAADAMPHLLGYAAQSAALTRALHAGVQRASGAHAVAILDRASQDAPARWRPATGTDLARLTGNLTDAARWAGPARTHATRTPTAAGPVAGLSAAIEARRDQLRPARPSTAALTGAYTRNRRTPHHADPPT